MLCEKAFSNSSLTDQSTSLMLSYSDISVVLLLLVLHGSFEASYQMRWQRNLLVGEHNTPDHLKALLQTCVFVPVSVNDKECNVQAFCR